MGDVAETGKSSWPVDRIVEGEGKVHIEGKYIHPMEVEHAALPTYTLWFVYAVLVGMYLPREIGHPVPWIIGGFFAAPIVLWFPIRLLIRRQLRVAIGGDAIEVNGRRYSREIGNIEFAVERHRKAVIEEERGSTSRIYRNAIEAIMHYGEQRISVAEMRARDQEKAIALIKRMGKWSDAFERAKHHIGKEAGQVPEQSGSDFGRPPDVV